MPLVTNVAKAPAPKSGSDAAPKGPGRATPALKKGVVTPTPSKGGVTSGGATSKGAVATPKGAEGSRSRSPIASRKPLPGSKAEERTKEAQKKQAAEEAAKKAAEEAEKAKIEAHLKAKEEKRAHLAHSHAEQIRRRRDEELEVQHQRNQLRADENARKRLAREEKEKAAAWPYRMQLHAAALTGNQEVAEVFLREDEKGEFNVSRIDPNVKWSEDGQSPIFLAAVKGQIQMIQRLIKAKADVNMANHDARAPLALAAEFGQV